jgi:phospholipid/cholesterol/gamma-HCH transport system substrate-binding protein
MAEMLVYWSGIPIKYGRKMRSNIIEAVMGTIVLIIASFFLVFAYTSSQATVSHGYQLKARFDRIDGLLVGNDVRVSGVKVGLVKSIRIDPKTYLAEVTMTVQDSVQIPKDSSAEIISESLMGGKYIALVPGGDESYIAPEGIVVNTQSAISLEGLIGKYIFSSADKDKKKED